MTIHQLLGKAPDAKDPVAMAIRGHTKLALNANDDSLLAFGPLLEAKNTERWLSWAVGFVGGDSVSDGGRSSHCRTTLDPSTL
jgi:hypothetical protein